MKRIIIIATLIGLPFVSISQETHTSEVKKETSSIATKNEIVGVCVFVKMKLIKKHVF